MKKENSFVGQIDLLSILGAEIKRIDSVECIVIPVKGNPTIDIFMRKNGRMGACLNMYLNYSDGKYGNSHYVKAAISRKAIERFSLTEEQFWRFCPILGNIRPTQSENQEKSHVKEFNKLYHSQNRK